MFFVDVAYTALTKTSVAHTQYNDYIKITASYSRNSSAFMHTPVVVVLN